MSSHWESGLKVDAPPVSVLPIGFPVVASSNSCGSPANVRKAIPELPEPFR